MWIFPQWAITIVKWVEGKPDDKEKKLTNQKKNKKTCCVILSKLLLNRIAKEKGGLVIPEN